MANTVIQLKFSNITATPTTLNVAEPAYSYTSNTLFIGSPAGTGSIAIGGKFYLDQQQDIYNTANAAFNAANTGAAAQLAFNQANAAFIAANSAGVYANSAFLAANIADAKAVTAGSYANSAFATANNEAGVNLTQNNSITAAFTAANSAGVYANGAFEAANTADNKATSAGVYANGAFVAANTAQASATAAFIRANNSISANAGGTITGSLVVTGNLTVQGNTTFVDTEILSVEDSLIKLANNNTSDTVDIGFYGQYDSTGTKYAGLARNAATDNFFLFKGLTADPAGNTLASGSVTAANAATLIANVSAYSVTIGGQNIQTYTDNAYNTANAAFLSANNINGVDLTQNNSITAAFAAANAATATDTTQNNSITAAFTAANSAGVYANGAFAAANAATATDTTQNNSIEAAFTAANSAGVYANGAFAAANTDFTGITITAADHGTASAVASFRVEANGRISSANNTAIAIDTSAITSGTLGVARGGTGAGSFTTNGVLLGQGTSALTTASSSTEGHVLTINNTGVPTFSHLSGGTF